MIYLVFYNEASLANHKLYHGRDYQRFSSLEKAREFFLTDIKNASIIAVLEEELAAAILQDLLQQVVEDTDFTKTLTETPELQDQLQLFIQDYWNK